MKSSTRTPKRRRFKVNLRVTLGFVKEHLGEEEYERAVKLADLNPTNDESSTPKGQGGHHASQPKRTKNPPPANDAKAKEMLQKLVADNGARAAMSAGRTPKGEKCIYSVIIKKEMVSLMRELFQETSIRFDESPCTGKLEGAVTFRFKSVGTPAPVVVVRRGLSAFEKAHLERFEGLLATLGVNVVKKDVHTSGPNLATYVVKKGSVVKEDVFVGIMHNVGIEIRTTVLKQVKKKGSVVKISIERPEPPFEYVIGDVAVYVKEKLALKSVDRYQLTRAMVEGFAQAANKYLGAQ